MATNRHTNVATYARWCAPSVASLKNKPFLQRYMWGGMRTYSTNGREWHSCPISSVITYMYTPTQVGVYIH